MQAKRKLIDERRTLKKCAEPSRRKSHWDFVLEEMKWMANDFWQVHGYCLTSETTTTCESKFVLFEDGIWVCWCLYLFIFPSFSLFFVVHIVLLQSENTGLVRWYRGVCLLCMTPVCCCLFQERTWKRYQAAHVCLEIAMKKGEVEFLAAGLIREQRRVSSILARAVTDFWHRAEMAVTKAKSDGKSIKEQLKKRTSDSEFVPMDVDCPVTKEVKLF